MGGCFTPSVLWNRLNLALCVSITWPKNQIDQKPSPPPLGDAESTGQSFYTFKQCHQQPCYVSLTWECPTLSLFRWEILAPVGQEASKAGQPPCLSFGGKGRFLGAWVDGSGTIPSSRLWALPRVLSRPMPNVAYAGLMSPNV